MYRKYKNFELFGSHDYISVCHNNRFSKEDLFEPITINWKCSGALSIESAEEFLKKLNCAIIFAKKQREIEDKH